MKLTPKEERFVEEYLLDLNASRAARDAGFGKTADSSATLGRRLVRKSSVKKAIQKAKDERSKRTNIVADDVLREVALLAHSDVGHYSISDEGTVELVEGAPKLAMRAISSIKRKTFFYEDGNCRREVEVKLWDKPAALRMAGSHLGLWDERTSQNGATILVVNPYGEKKK